MRCTAKTGGRAFITGECSGFTWCRHRQAARGRDRLDKWAQNAADFAWQNRGSGLKNNQDLEVLPPPAKPKKRPRALNSIRAVRKRMEKLYAAVEAGEIPSDEAARRTYLLREMRSCLEAEPEPATRGGYVREINVIGIPSGWAVAALYGKKAHLPTETLHKLKELLPPAAFESLPDPFLPDPIDDAPSARPMLRVHSNADVEPEPLPPAA